MIYTIREEDERGSDGTVYYSVFRGRRCLASGVTSPIASHILGARVLPHDTVQERNKNTTAKEYSGLRFLEERERDRLFDISC